MLCILVKKTMEKREIDALHLNCNKSLQDKIIYIYLDQIISIVSVLFTKSRIFDQTDRIY